MTSERFDNLRTHDSPCVQECLDEIARLAALVYMPGSYYCPKCKFQAHKSILHAKSGNIGVDYHCDEGCPNDGTPLLPMTWEQAARAMAVFMPEFARLKKWERDMNSKGSK